MVNLYSDESLEEFIGRVRGSQNLDYFDGRNTCNGSMGNHLGITKLKQYEESYALIHTTDWQGKRDFAYIVDDDTALKEILESGNTHLLEEKRFSRLKELYEEKYMDLEDLDD